MSGMIFVVKVLDGISSEEAIRRAPDLGLEVLTAGIFAHNTSSIRLFESFGFEKWAHFPGVADLDCERRDLIIMGLTLQ